MTVQPECAARRPERGDGECTGPVEWEAVYRSAARGHTVLQRVPGCYTHANAEVTRALAAATIAHVDIERLVAADTPVTGSGRGA